MESSVHRQLVFIVLTVALSLAANAQSPAVAGIVGKAMALHPDRKRGSALYAKRCSPCHGSDAWGDGFEDIPSLAGQQELYLVTQIVEFATRERSGSTMHEATGTKDGASGFNESFRSSFLSSFAFVSV